MYLRLLKNLVFILPLILMFFPSLSFAGSNTPVGEMLCTVSDWATGNTGKGIATLSIVMLGILALMNKISWNMAILHIVGIGLLEGAATFVNAMNAGGTGC